MNRNKIKLIRNTQTSYKINQHKIVKKVKVINNFYKRVFRKKPNFAILSLNPHNFSPAKKSEEENPGDVEEYY